MADLADLADMFGSEFPSRHIGPREGEIEQMLAVVGAGSLGDLADRVVPEGIRLRRPLALPPALAEADALAELAQIAGRNTGARDHIGLGYYPTEVPAVIQRNVLENPGWYTAYTPYQPEIAQGRLEALITFQQVVQDLTGMPLANASLLDEATAAAEAMAMAHRVNRASRSNAFFVADGVLPQTLAVIRTRAAYYGFEVITGPAEEAAAAAPFGALLQYPQADGRVVDLGPIVESLHERGSLAIVAADLLALTLLVPPGERGADIVVGTSQRLGVPVGYGGPHAGYLACREDYKRSLPGRLIGVSQDAGGRPAYRMALQTREQHIRRERATSNICTAQVLLANMAAFYAIHHGPDGLRRIAERIHLLTASLAAALLDDGVDVAAGPFFDTLTLRPGDPDLVRKRAAEERINLRWDEGGTVGLSLNETTRPADMADLRYVLSGMRAPVPAASSGVPEGLRRTSSFLTHPVFHEHRSETQLMRYAKKLENKDLSLVHSMIPLGSCTMKLNAAAEMLPVSWPALAAPHPFAPGDQVAGYGRLLAELADMLAEITGFAAVSLQPNSGAQGEYAGLLAIRRYQRAIGEGRRDICLIPQSAHGTNPASAQMMGLEVVVVATDLDGNIDIKDLEEKATAAGDRLSCVMITYPSTHGVYEESVQRVCEIVHGQGGQVYLDGANLNAQVGLTRPGDIGADVSHLNLHKTFAIPHGGGGPGMGPIGVAAHLAEYLPGHGAPDSWAVSAAPYGSASILPISWMYIRMLGPDGLTRASEVALLSANYVAARLREHYPILYTGRDGLVAHECIIDLRPLKAATGITEVDVAKRLMDYGFHAPTMSFPVAGTFMIEPTESESLPELDRFVEAMIAIRGEIERVAAGDWPADNNPLVRAPHTAEDIAGEWARPYTRAEAVYPLPWVAEAKFWPSVNRIDEVWGDRNLFCSCPAPADLQS